MSRWNQHGRWKGVARVLVPLGLAAANVVGCPIPVFQFALEHWETDPYRVTVHFDGQLNERETEAADLLRRTREEGEGKANVTVTWRDYSKGSIPPPEDLRLPLVEVRYPEGSRIPGIVWSGPLDPEKIGNLLHSPARGRILENLLKRHAAVWVLLRSGNTREDRRMERFLREELARLEQTLQVPDPGHAQAMGFGRIQTEIGFSLLTIDRDDPREGALIAMLLGTERDLREHAGRPIVFPIYGRGLAMYALVGDGINRWTLNQAGEFLTGPCSCQVKAGNPGTDLLLTADWEAGVERHSTFGSVIPPGAAGFMDQLEETSATLP